jgi:hypothetical protein
VASNAYSAELQVDPILRRCVVGTGLLLLLAGVAAVFTLPVPLMQRGAAAALWSAGCGCSIWRLVGAWGTYVALRISPDGIVRLRQADSEWQDAVLLPGSVLLRDWGWIRLRPRGGPAFAEPLCGTRQNRQDWRRLQVIWRHVGTPA